MGINNLDASIKLPSNDSIKTKVNFIISLKICILKKFKITKNSGYFYQIFYELLDNLFEITRILVEITRK